MRRLYDWVMGLARHRHAIPAMGVVSFAESSFFPIPPDVMLVPMILANRQKAFKIAVVCTVCSVLGGLLGYAIGFYFFETIGAWVVKTYGLQAGLEKFRDEFTRYGTWVILIKGLTPIPYKLVTIASGAAHFDLFTFVWASIVTRGAHNRRKLEQRATFAIECGTRIPRLAHGRDARATRRFTFGPITIYYLAFNPSYQFTVRDLVITIYGRV